MIEIILGIMMVVTMGKIADADGQSGILWGSVAFLVGFLCLFIPFPYARILIAAVITFAAMTVYKMVRK